MLTRNPLDAFLEELSEHVTLKLKNKCLPKPYGCGGKARVFSSEQIKVIHAETGLCEACQIKRKLK